MPIYEYWCQQCRTSIEKLVPMSAGDKDVECPACGAQAKRMLSVISTAGRNRESEAYAGGGCGCGGACSCGHHNN